MVQAHALVHDGGTAALTMRPLAASLGTSTSALYRIVPSKEWLLVAIVDLVFSEVDTSVADADGTSGRQRLERLSIALRDVMAAHPHLHAVLTSHVAITPSTVRVAESSLSCLRGMGIADPDLVDAYNSWFGYVIGFTAVESMPPEHEPDPQLWGRDASAFGLGRGGRVDRGRADARHREPRSRPVVAAGIAARHGRASRGASPSCSTDSRRAGPAPAGTLQAHLRAISPRLRPTRSWPGSLRG